MNKQECQQLIDAYVEWLRKGLSARSLERSCEITSPFLDRHNDHIQIYATKRDGTIVLSDDGYILSDLRTSGLELTTQKRKAVLDTALKGFGVRIEGKQLVVDANQRNLGQKIHTLIQAMLAVNDMFVMAQPRVASFFWEDVRAFLDEHEVRYSARVKVTGRSGFDHAIDFLIPHSKTRPERIVQAINAPSRNTIGSYLFTLSDTRDARGGDSEAYAFLNDRDRDREIGADVMEALQAYEVTPALWSHRQEYVSALVN